MNERFRGRRRSRGEPAEVAPPPRWLALFEGARALSEASLLIPAHALLRRIGRGGDGHAVMTLPGFLAGDGSTGVLRHYLKSWGYAAHGWGIGRNMGPSRYTDIERLLRERLAALADGTGSKVSLIGWSLGGVFARELARSMPQAVRQVITLGSPIGGGPRATNAWRIFDWVSNARLDGRPMRNRIALATQPVDGIPSTAVYSKSDAVVAWQIARETESPLTDNIAVRGSSHLGLGFNPAVLYIIADRLRLPEDDWRKFDRGVLGPLVYE